AMTATPQRWRHKWSACTICLLPWPSASQLNPRSICNLTQHRSESHHNAYYRDPILIVYEYPFNERIRTLLRLEDLYEKFTFFLHQEHAMQHHVALSTIFDMLEVAGRADLKSDLLQELERQKQTLLGFKSNPNVQIEALNAVLSELDRTSAALMAAQGKTGQNVRD